MAKDDSLTVAVRRHCLILEGRVGVKILRASCDASWLGPFHIKERLSTTLDFSPTACRRYLNLPKGGQISAVLLLICAIIRLNS